MLVVFYGNDQIKVRSEAHRFIDSKIKEGQELVRIENDGYESGQLMNVSGAVALFGGGYIYMIDSLSENKLAYEELLEQLEVLSSSPNLFVVIEQGLKLSDKKKFTEYTDEIKEFKKEAETRFNAFALAEALANKDRKQLWILLQEAKQNKLAAEEIIGVIWWQLKTLRLANLTTSASEVGMKDYPYNKAKRALRNFKEGELEKLSLGLLQLYHDGHAGRRDIDLALEEWVLRG